MYSEQELKPWVEKVDQIRKQTNILRVYFNNHYGGKAVVNAMQFKEMWHIVICRRKKSIGKRTSTYPWKIAWMIAALYEIGNQKAYFVLYRQQDIVVPLVILLYRAIFKYTWRCGSNLNTGDKNLAPALTLRFETC